MQSNRIFGDQEVFVRSNDLSRRTLSAVCVYGNVDDDDDDDDDCDDCCEGGDFSVECKSLVWLPQAGPLERVSLNPRRVS